MSTPAADIAVTPALVARLVHTQHPDLAGGRLTPVANGWDNAIYRLGEDLCVRLPRRQVAAELVRNEQRWLPLLAERVEVPVPAPVRVGRPTADYPWAWSVNPWFAGRPAMEVPPAERGGIAVELAEFLARLHVPAPEEAPRNPVRGVPLAARSSAVYERLSSGVLPHTEKLRRLWDRLAAVSPWSGPPLWLHGDLHPANILLGPDPGAGRRRLCAIIDFGDLTAGDPATDLAVGWLAFDAEGYAAFRAHLDRIADLDEDTWARARGWALCVGTAIAANSGDNPRMAAIGAHAIERVLAEP